MLSRFIANPCRHLRRLSLTLSPHFHPSPPLSPSVPPPQIPKFGLFTHLISRHFSTNGSNGNNNNNNNNNGEKPTSDLWKIGPKDDIFDDIFTKAEVGLTGFPEAGNGEGEKPKGSEPLWGAVGIEDGGDVDVFGRREGKSGGGGGAVDDWLNTVGGESKPWSLEEEDKKEDVFDLGNVGMESEDEEVKLERERKKAENDLELQKEEEALLEVLKGKSYS